MQQTQEKTGGGTASHQSGLMSFGSSEQFQQQIDAQLQDNEQCSAIPFIKFVPENGKFELGEEAEAFLKGLVDIKLGVVAVCGKYRTGKSYLLNKLFVEQYFQNNKQKNNGFQVSPTINACTKGLWLWKKVIYMQNPGQPELPPVAMIVVDTEGLGAYDEDENHDAKIFLLALLLSSLLIYNSVGTIDENALNSLSLVINLSKKIQLKSGNNTDDQGGGDDGDEQIAKIFPSFLWVLRDFALKLVDAEGNKMTPKQYLESALREQKGCSEATEGKNRVRRMLTHFFHERDCCTLVRPTEQEKNLQTLIKLPESELRVEFVQEMNRLKTKVALKAKPKCMNGHPLNGPMLIQLANSYIQALNDGEVPVIENAWTNVCHFEQERCYKEAQMCFQMQITSRLKCSKDPNIDIKGTLKQIKENSFIALKKDFIGELKQLETYKERLGQELKIQSKAAVKDIMGRQDEYMKTLIAQRIETDLESKIRRGIGCTHNQLSDFASILAYSEELLHKLKEENPLLNHERLEQLFRTQLMKERLPKLLESVHTQHCKTPSDSSLRTLEQSLKLADEEIHRLKVERSLQRQESWEKTSQEERERQERLMREKVMSIKFTELQQKLQEAQVQLKFYRGKEMRETGNQTESKIMVESQVQCQMIETQNSAKESMSGNPPHYMEVNMRLLQEILATLNSNSTTTSMFDQPQVTEIIKNNQVLSNAIDQSERRCSVLEKKVEKKVKYEQLIKNCQRLQCIECNKLYTPNLFTQHFVHCKQRISSLSSSSGVVAAVPISGVESQRISQTSSQVNFQLQDEDCGQHFQTEVIIETPVSNESELYEGGCQEPEGILNTPPMNNFNEFLRYQQKHQMPIQAPSTTSYLFSIKVINVLVQNQGHTFSSPYFKGSHQNSVSPQTLYSIDSIDIEFQVLFQKRKNEHEAHAMKVTKNIQDVKACMARIQRRMVQSPSEQSQIAKSIIDIDQCIHNQQYNRIAQIIELFFSDIQQKLLDNNLQLNKHVIVEDIEGREAPQHYYINELVDFFNIQAASCSSEDQGVRPFNLQSQQYPKFSRQHYPCGNDDEEVIMQTPYDEEDIVFNKVISITGLTQSKAVNQLDIEHNHQAPMRINQDNSFNNSLTSHQIVNRAGNHNLCGQAMITTMHLDGDQSINNNSALHMVSFFSVEEDDQQSQGLGLKKNFLPQGSSEVCDTSSLENFGKRLAANHPTQEEVDIDDLSSSQSTQQRDFEMVSAKDHHQFAPFQPIQNRMGQAGAMQTGNIYDFVQLMKGDTGNNNALVQRAQTVKVVMPHHPPYDANKKDYHSPYLGKKSTAVGSRLRTHRPLLPTAPATKEHQFYFAQSENPNMAKNRIVSDRHHKQPFTARPGLGGDTSENHFVDQQ